MTAGAATPVAASAVSAAFKSAVKVGGKAVAQKATKLEVKYETLRAKYDQDLASLAETRLKLAGSENLKRACNLCAAARRSSQSGEPPGAEERAREMSVLSQRGREMSVLSVMSQLSPRGGRSDMV